MSLTDLLEDGRLQRHRPTAQEIRDLLHLAAQSLADARTETISVDSRLILVYGAALNLATVALQRERRRIHIGHRADTRSPDHNRCADQGGSGFVGNFPGDSSLLRKGPLQ